MPEPDPLFLRKFKKTKNPLPEGTEKKMFM
jgi:hypothetical protein